MVKSTITATGYGVLAHDGPSTNQRSDFTHSYGSLDNNFAHNSTSTTDSCHRWFVEGLDNDYEIESAYTAHGTPRQSNLGNYQDFYNDDSYITDNPDSSLLDPHYVDNLSGENQHLIDSYTTNGLASTPLVAWNLTNLLLSTSLLAFPFIVRQAGYIVLPIAFLIAMMLNYTSRILIDLMYENLPEYDNQRVRVRKHITEIGREVFNSEKGAKVVHVVQIIEMLCICILNICVLGQLGHEISNYNVQLCTAIAALFAFPTFFIRKLAIIGWLQTIGVISLAIGIMLIQGWCLVHAEKFKTDNIPIVQWHKLPIAIGVVVYAYGIQGVLPGMEEQMRKPQQFGRVINWTFSVSFILQCVFSLTNAMYYGEETAQVIVIDMKDHFELGITSACFIGISILSHFSLPTLVVMESLDNAIVKTSSCCPTRQQTLHTFLMVLLRIGIIALCLGLALVLPYFAYLMGFIGSSITLTMCLIIPCTFHLKMRYDTLRWHQICLDVVIIVSSLVCLGAGSYFSFESIYYDWVNGSYN